jgi:putative sterol carrier protein
MTLYTNADQFYACAKRLFSEMETTNPRAADPILASQMVIRMRFTEPEAEFTINGRRRPVQTTFGPSNLRPTLEIGMAAETLHRILLGELSVRTAVADGRLEVRGPVWKVKPLADFFHELQARYAEILDENGLPAC